MVTNIYEPEGIKEWTLDRGMGMNGVLKTP